MLKKEYGMVLIHIIMCIYIYTEVMARHISVCLGLSEKRTVKLGSLPPLQLIPKLLGASGLLLVGGLSHGLGLEVRRCPHQTR